ncbi:hypothetical protein RFI_10044 [Reticulomyxa filosa]|uniref:peptidylprolyl isomerase n=1 Tax=Reticulomyxa filosa TaxID=46433 RepID=X6NM48_RETFI|nr:hypothetical protein RFI_10044 [Reticulomyxa filosa]|eukprot:ETO27086.1 hypothetical protein RFI_10044 [Reticulomyxa filosa]
MPKHGSAKNKKSSKNVKNDKKKSNVGDKNSKENLKDADYSVKVRHVINYWSRTECHSDKLLPFQLLKKIVQFTYQRFERGVKVKKKHLDITWQCVHTALLNFTTFANQTVFGLVLNAGFLHGGSRHGKRNAPFDFVIGKREVIRGWDEGILKMTLGEKALLQISSDYAYGSQGRPNLSTPGEQYAIPPNSDLLFEVELLKIN